jgi:hypothetical protein
VVILPIVFGGAFIFFIFTSFIISALSLFSDNQFLRAVHKNKNLILELLFINTLSSMVAYSITFQDMNSFLRYIIISGCYAFIIYNCVKIVKLIKGQG